MGSLRLSEFRQPFLEVFLIFLLKFGIARAAIDFARLVLAFTELFLGPLIVKADFVSVVQRFLYKLRGNEIDAFEASQLGHRCAREH